MNTAHRTNKNVERGRATRAHVIEVATRLFAEQGYDGTSIEAVQAAAGVSRGSLYHHFPGKEALFLAVLEDLGGRLGAEMTAAIQDAANPLDMLRIGCVTWIRQAGDPVVQQIALIDAPAVLGWQRWRELDEPALDMIRYAIGYAAEAGTVDPRHVDVFAHIVMATLNEVAMMIALASDSAATLKTGESAVNDLLDRLVGAPGRAAAN